MAAWGPVSAVLGRDLPAYRLVGLGARNPAQQFVVRFSRAGAMVSARAERLGVALSGIGYGSTLRGVGPVAPRESRGRVTYAYRSLTAWWANGPLGLEQGFDLPTRPGSGGGPLTLSLAFSGGLRAGMEHGSVLLLGRKAALTYGGLHVSDAHGQLLRSWLQLVPGGVLIRVDDRGAAYPLRIDPFLQQAILRASGGALGDAFGRSVAVSGDTIVVGAEFHKIGSSRSQGAAYVFVRPPSGWANATETARLTASNGAAGDDFGESVAISRNTIVVGAAFHKVGKHRQQGEAYVFVRPRAGWTGTRTETARLVASDGAVKDWFGGSVAVSGDTIVVGSYRHTIGRRAQQGKAYVFVRAKSGWTGTRTQTASLTSSNGDTQDWFGWSVAVSGNTIAVGAPLHTVGKRVHEGEAYLFVKPGTGWAGKRTETARLTASNGAHDLLGSTVGVSGNTVVVAAPQRKVSNHAFQGELDVFVRPRSGWSGTRTQTGRLVASDGVGHADGGDELGAFSLAISSDTILSSAASHTVAKNFQQGEAYVFVRPRAGWAGTHTETAKLTSSNGAAGDYFGNAVALTANTIVIGAMSHKPVNPLTPGRGKAYVFVRDPTGGRG